MEAAYTLGDEWLDQLIIYLEQNFRILESELKTAVPGLIVSPLQATYLAWIDFSFLKKSDRELKEFMVREARVGLNDGPMFGPGGANHQRMNIATTREVLRNGLEQLAGAVARAL